MGGRSGSSGIGGGGGNISKYVNETRGVGKIDLTDNPLQYGPKDYSINKKVRSTAEEFAERHKKDRVEFVAAIDKKGEILDEAVGDEHSATLSNRSLSRAVELTHNHPGKTGLLGGTFSEADISSYTEYENIRTMRAEAKEGSYSITKKVGYNGTGLQNYIGSEMKKYRSQLNSRVKQLENQKNSGKISEAKYRSEVIKESNKYLVNLHNSYIAGQKKYGYAYTLERRKKP